MKIDPRKFGWAGAIAVAVLWTFYSIVVFLLFILAINLSGDFGYTDVANFDWQPPLVKFILILSVLSFGAMLTGRLTAEIYNFLVDRCAIKLR
jgi:hypothetical protein